MVSIWGLVAKMMTVIMYAYLKPLVSDILITMSL